MANKKIKTTELDFDEIKLNLKEFLKGQSEFQDYDFEGSALSVLLDILAYNTHYNALYDNLAINELFLDSAIKRSSVVSLAKTLGYTPRSATSAKAIVKLTATSAASGPSVVTIPAYTAFSTSVDGATFNFYNREPVSATGTSTSYTFTDVELVEGEVLEFKYTVSDNARYIIPNANVDIETLRVRVQESSTSSSFETFTRSTSLISVDANTKVYWVKEIDDGLYELTFGNGVIGKALENGNVVRIEYIVSSLDLPNGAKLFNYNGPTLWEGASVSVSASTPAYGGSGPEAIDSIKFNAPRSYAAQNRAVTTEDYKTIIYSLFSEAKSVQVWGGEDNNPPIYGKTFICVKPKTTDRLTTQQKSDILDILAPRSTVSVLPEIVDPDYLRIAVEVGVYYNPANTTRTKSELENLVRETIFNYDDSELQKFEGVFRYSKLSSLIDSTETSIVSNIMRVVLHRSIAPRFNVNAQYSLSIINPIYSSEVPEESIISSGFFINGSDETHYLDDDGIGNVRLFYIRPNFGKVIVRANAGTVDYENGSLVVNDLNVTAVEGSAINFTIKPKSYDVVSAYNQIAQIDRDNLSINVIADRSTVGDLRAGNNYTFTAIR